MDHGGDEWFTGQGAYLLLRLCAACSLATQRAAVGRSHSQALSQLCAHMADLTWPPVPVFFHTCMKSSSIGREKELVP